MALDTKRSYSNEAETEKHLWWFQIEKNISFPWL